VTSWEFNGLTEREKSIVPPNWQMSFSFLRTGQCSSWLRPKMQTYEECESATVGYGQRLQEWAQIQYSFYWLRQTTLQCRVHVTCILNVKQVQGRFNGNWRSGRATLTVSHPKNNFEHKIVCKLSDFHAVVDKMNVFFGICSVSLFRLCILDRASLW